MRNDELARAHQEAADANHKRGGGKAAAPAPTAADLDALRARLAEAARRYAEYERLLTLLAPYAEETTSTLFPFTLALLEGTPVEIVRPTLNGLSLPQVLAGATDRAGDPAAMVPVGQLAPGQTLAQPEPESTAGPVDLFLEEFEHLGNDGLATDLVEAALVLFPDEDGVRTALSGTRKQVLDAVLAREFPGVMKSTRMQIVVAAEPRGLRLPDISDLVKMVHEGGATAAEVRSLLRSM